MCRLMGIPDEDVHWGRRWASSETTALAWMPVEVHERRRETSGQMLSYLTGKVLERHAQPGDA